MNQQERSKQMISMILKSAAEIFAEKGYDLATLQEITLKAGISKGAIYHHFRGKQDILDRLIHNTLDEINQSIHRLVKAPNMTAQEKIEEILFLFSNPMQDTFIRNQWAEKVPTSLLATLRNTTTVLSGYLTEIIQQGTDEGCFNCAAPKEVAGVICLLFDIWVDPNIVEIGYEEYCNRVDFIRDFARNYGVYLDDGFWEKVKESRSRYYE